jgi:imidazolonepropionase-like amidohydrolase
MNRTAHYAGVAPSFITYVVFLVCLLLGAPVESGQSSREGRLEGRAGTISEKRPIALTHVTVIDTRDGSYESDMTVVIENARIVSVDKSPGMRLADDVQPIDARGKYLIPGLWDMHVHMFPDLQRSLPLFIANGITGVRDMGGIRQYFDRYMQAQREAQGLGGAPVVPRIVAAGEIIDGSPPYNDAMLSVDTVEDARAAVRSVRQNGADFIKVYTYLGRAAYFAIAEEVRHQGLPFVGHIPYAVSAGEASDSGQKSIEHADGILLAASTEESQIRDEILKNVPVMRGNKLQEFELYYIQANFLPIRSYSEYKAAALFERFVRNGTWVCPTLFVHRVIVFPEEEKHVTADLAARYVPAFTQEAWMNYMREVAWNPREAHDVVEVYHTMLKLVGDLNRAGVGLLAGTDLGAPYILPGFSLHRELELLVAAGLTPLQALQTATLNPARFLGKEADLGTIEKGKLADLVLLGADPLEDIRNTKKIDAVVANGAYLTKDQLQGMLAEVAAGVGKQ